MPIYAPMCQKKSATDPWFVADFDMMFKTKKPNHKLAGLTHNK